MYKIEFKIGGRKVENFEIGVKFVRRNYSFVGKGFSKVTEFHLSKAVKTLKCPQCKSKDIGYIARDYDEDGFEFWLACEHCDGNVVLKLGD